MSKTKLLPVMSMLICGLGACGALQAASAQLRVVPGSDLHLWWQRDHSSTNHPPPYPIDALKAQAEGCMAVAFEINNDGSVSNERIWLDKTPHFHATKSWEQGTLVAVHQWRYIPAPANTNRDSVYTYQIVTFTIGGSKWTDYDQQRDDKHKAKCEISDFPQQVQAMIRANAKTAGGSL